MEGSFWPIAHRIKERQSSNRNGGSGHNKGSDIEQGVPAPVEFAVTACHAMRGSGSSEINIAEQGSLCVEEFGVTPFHQNGGGTNHFINVTEQKALCLVEFTVTACHALHGSGSSEINVTERGTILPIFFQWIVMMRLSTNVSGRPPRTTSQNEDSNTFTSPRKRCQAYVSLPHTRGQ
jgi:hypothetical protein